MACCKRKVSLAGLSHAVRLDSAGTHNYHPGSPPDKRSQKHANLRGYDLSALHARQVQNTDFAAFDLILAMDRDNLALLQACCPLAHQHKLRRLTEFCQTFDATLVPDPYYEGAVGFDKVLDLVEVACEGLMAHVRRQMASH